jgi:hypothetical protein
MKNVSDPVELLKIALDSPPLRAKEESTKLKYLELVLNCLGKFNIDKIEDEMLKKISIKEATTLYDYMNKSF